MRGTVNVPWWNDAPGVTSAAGLTTPARWYFVFGPGQENADDVVAHEFTHAVTGTLLDSDLNTAEAGAIDEGLSDIFGEFVDQWNGDDGTPWAVG